MIVICRALVFTLAVGGWLLIDTATASANDTTISCSKPPEKGARVAVHPGSQVSVTQDHQAQTCVFAINGAVATSPPPQQILDALNLFRDPTKRFLVEKDNASSALAALLAEAAPIDQVPGGLTDILRKVGERLNDCLADFFNYQKLPAIKLLNDTFLCTGFPPYRDEHAKSEMLAATGVAAGVPTLAISVRWEDGRFTSTVYLPSTIFGPPIIQNR